MPELTSSTREAARRIGVTETALRKAEQTRGVSPSQAPHRMRHSWPRSKLPRRAPRYQQRVNQWPANRRDGRSAHRYVSPGRTVDLRINDGPILSAELSLVCRDVGDHALLVGDHLHLAWHLANIDQKSIHLDKPDEWVPINVAP